MHHLIRALVLVAALGLAACDGGDDPQQQAFATGLRGEFVVGYGETAHFGSLSITFDAVTEDTRCPFNASCIAFWEGNARILLSVTNGSVSDILELNTNSDFATFAVFDGHYIELRRLDPLPWMPPRAPDEYNATLMVDERGLSERG